MNAVDRMRCQQILQPADFSVVAKPDGKSTKLSTEISSTIAGDAGIENDVTEAIVAVDIRRTANISFCDKHIWQTSRYS